MGRERSRASRVQRWRAGAPYGVCVSLCKCRCRSSECRGRGLGRVERFACARRAGTKAAGRTANLWSAACERFRELRLALSLDPATKAPQCSPGRRRGAPPSRGPSALSTKDQKLALTATLAERALLMQGRCQASHLDDCTPARRRALLCSCARARRTSRAGSESKQRSFAPPCSSLPCAGSPSWL